MTAERVEVAVVGGGPAGATLSGALARAGHDVIVLERMVAWRWHACGVFTSPAALAALRRSGLDAPTIARLARPIPAMRVETPQGSSFRLTYGAEGGGQPAVGFDRRALDGVLLERAQVAGADVRRGWAVRSIEPETGALQVMTSEGRELRLEAAVVVGADGLRSIVARAAGVVRPSRLGRRVGLTYHLPDPRGSDADARMVVIRDGYVGLAPVPGGRLNVGIVLGRSWHASLAARGAAALTRRIVADLPLPRDDDGAWRTADSLDQVAGASPLGHRVARRAGRHWLLVGDAAGFLDPFTGEGLHRALVSAELAAEAIHGRRGDDAAFGGYEAAMRRRFLGKDIVSLVVQAFLARPVGFEYAARRLAARPAVRATMGLVMGDLVPASELLDPRYLVRLLAP